MARPRNPDRIKAEEIYLEHKGNIELTKIAEIVGRPAGTIRGWKNKDCWDEKLNGTFQTKSERSKPKKGGQPGNSNAVGNIGGDGAPEGNLNSVKHGAYQSVYEDMLNVEDQILFNMIRPTTNIDDEIRLLRLKIARLLNMEIDFFYNAYGEKVQKYISEEDRLNGINACMDQLRKLISDKAKMSNDTEKLKIAQEKLMLEKSKVSGDDGEIEDDGFLDALDGRIEQVWDDYDEED